MFYETAHKRWTVVQGPGSAVPVNDLPREKNWKLLFFTMTRASMSTVLHFLFVLVSVHTCNSLVFLSRSATAMFAQRQLSTGMVHPPTFTMRVRVY